MPKTEEAKAEARLHNWLVGEIYDHLNTVCHQLSRIEAERALQYGRTDPIAVKAYEVRQGVRKQTDGVAEILRKLHEEDPPEEASMAGSSTSEFVWIKMGTAGKYGAVNTPYDAGSAIAQKLGLRPEEREHLRFGYEVSAVNIEPTYVGHNRISLFWGEDYGHWIRDLSPTEQKDFERGLTEVIR